jgi:taurine dioxygenase
LEGGVTTVAAAQSFTRLSVEPLTARIGAEIHGVDLRQELHDEVIAEIRKALLTYKVIFFRDQDISQEMHIAFGRRFGELDIHPLTAKDQPNPEVYQLKSEPSRTTGGDVWHADLTWRDTPALGSILLGRVIPEVGGDTLFADMTAAYEGLSPAIKEWVCTLTATHDASVFAVRAAERGKTLDVAIPEPQEHPVVRIHPETGERILYVNRSFTKGIKGLSPKESDRLLEHLFSQASIPDYQCRFRWRTNSIAFWDNRSCQHYAVGDYLPALRHMERVTVVGDRPFFDPGR